MPSEQRVPQQAKHTKLVRQHSGSELWRRGEFRQWQGIPHPLCCLYYRLEAEDPAGQQLFITCTLEPPGRDPKLLSAGCERLFTVDNHIKTVSYAARYAEDGAAIREKTTQLLRSFRGESNGEDTMAAIDGLRAAVPISPASAWTARNLPG
jgi:hypothetical protein